MILDVGSPDGAFGAPERLCFLALEFHEFPGLLGAPNGLKHVT